MDSISADYKQIIATKNGPLCGSIQNTNGRRYYKFKSIPYAKPPIGPLRFLPPRPVQPWTNVIDCTKDSPKLLDFNPKGELVGSEDCLYIEVSSPDINPANLLPVMFWIGCYEFSVTGDDYLDPTLLNDQGVVFVRCGFRMGPFGFLSINDFVAPGNSGLKDVALALKWVESNIHLFGGDPNNVTLFGSSAGGAIVHLLMLSPMVTGLFHKAIIQSASALNNWSLSKNPLQRVMELAQELDIKSNCAIDIVEELKNTSAQDIMLAFKKMKDKSLELNDSDSLDAIFKPCIEQDFEGQPAFLTKSPLSIIKSGNFNKVPLIIGANNVEAAVLQYIKSDFYNDFEKYNKNLHLLVPKSLSGEIKMSTKIGQQLLEFYLDGERCLTKDTRNQYLQLISDYCFLYYIYKTVQLHCQYAPDYPVYYYLVGQAGEWSVPEELKCFNDIGHCAEISYIFGLTLPGMEGIFKGSRDSVKTRKRVIKMWTNFAKYSNPTPDEHDPLLQIKWDPVESKEKLNYLCIGMELTKGRNPFQERMEFWEELHKEHIFLRTLVHFNDLGVIW